MAPKVEPDQATNAVRRRRNALESRLNTASIRLEAYCLLSDVLREKLEAIEIGPECEGECRQCSRAENCETEKRIVALEASVAELNRNLTQLQRLLGEIERGRS